MSSGQFVNALKVYTKAIVLAPQDAELRNDLGLVYFNIGSYAEAIKAFKQALDIESHNARAHYCLGLVYLDLGDIQMALEEHGQTQGPEVRSIWPSSYWIRFSFKASNKTRAIRGD